jgi:tRNA modification GTPase
MKPDLSLPSGPQPEGQGTPQAGTAARDTIVAIATPPGRGGIGIVRLSGPLALSCATPLLRLRAPLEPARARFCDIVDPATGDKLDEAVTTWFAASRSYTGEEVVEIAAHGSPVLLDFLVRSALANGARLANPGEFTERAFLFGRIDLTQSEAVRDLIEAQTLFQARVAASQLDGALSRRTHPIKQALLHIIAMLEAGIDFAEDDTPVLAAPQLTSLIEPIARDLAALEQSFVQGRLVHSGFTLAIIGEPNVGKSSLFNRLVERERAIVTAIPGTTRDLVTERVSLGGIPVEVIDTAGLRATSEGVERIGIEKSYQALADADLILLVLDATAALPNAKHEQPTESVLSEPLRPASEAALRPPTIPLLGGSASEVSDLSSLLATLRDRKVIVVLNKSDLVPSDALPREANLASAAPSDACTRASSTHSAQDAEQRGDMPQQQADKATFSDQAPKLGPMTVITSALPHAPALFTSAHTGQGIVALRETIQEQLQTPALNEGGAMLTNLRQHEAVRAAHSALLFALEAAHHAIPHEMLLLDLYTTLTHLNQLTGETTSEDILSLIFSTFCIGK